MKDKCFLKIQLRKTKYLVLIYIRQYLNFKMKLPFLLLLFLISFSRMVFAQEAITALITDPQVGSVNGEKYLSSIVEDINSRRNIELVVVLGNLTFMGKFDEFLLAQSILNNLKAPYLIIGGPRDILPSEGKGSELTQLWAKNEIFAQSKFSDRIYLETIPILNSDKGHISVETLKSISYLNSTQNNILIFSYFPLNEKTDNWYKLTNNFVRKKIISFSSLDGKKISDSFVESYNGESLADSKEWNYKLIYETVDSIKILKVSQNKFEIEDVIVKAKISNSVKIDSLQSVIYQPKLKIVYSSPPSVTTFSPLLLSEEKFFTTTLNGRVICQNYSGENIWQYETAGKIYNSILRDGDLIIVVTNAGDLFTINANNGDLVQAIGIGEPISSDINLIDLEYNDLNTKGIVFGTAYGNVYCYELYSLEMVWENYLTDKRIVGDPILIDNKIIYQVNLTNYYQLFYICSPVLLSHDDKIKARRQSCCVQRNFRAPGRNGSLKQPLPE